MGNMLSPKYVITIGTVVKNGPSKICGRQLLNKFT